jgi:tRNA acetyltransferase TAN1
MFWIVKVYLWMVLQINNFNLLISTSRFNEDNAKAELWFTLLMCGVKYPIISHLNYSGILSAFTNQDAREIINLIKEILKKDPNFFQYILKIIPIDFVCETNTEMIKELVHKYYRDYINPNETFMINLKRRKSIIIERESFIQKIASVIENKVNLTNPDKILWIEILGNRCGISFIRNTDVLTTNQIDN